MHFHVFYLLFTKCFSHSYFCSIESNRFQVLFKKLLSSFPLCRCTSLVYPRKNCKCRHWLNEGKVRIVGIPYLGPRGELIQLWQHSSWLSSPYFLYFFYSLYLGLLGGLMVSVRIFQYVGYFIQASLRVFHRRNNVQFKVAQLRAVQG